MLIVCDIDGTLASITKRHANAGLRPPKWCKRLFQMWLDKLQKENDMLEDPVHEEVLKALCCLSKSFKLVYLTGRSQSYRKVTRRWLKKIGAPKAPLLMRAQDNWQSPANYKEAVMHRLARKHGNQILVFDDDGNGDCAEMYRRNGWRHLKV